MADNEIDVTVRLRDALSRNARQAAAAVDKLESEVDELSRTTGAASKETQQAQRRLNALSGSAITAQKRLRALDRAAGKAEREVAGLNRETKQNARLSALAASAQKIFSTNLKKSKKDTQVFGQLLGGLKLPAIITGVTLLATAVGAVGAAGIAAVGGLAPLLGTAGAIPALGTAALQTMGVVKLAMSGIGDAIGVLADPAATAEETAAALKDLGPEARAFVRHVADLKDEGKELRRIAQEGMLPGFHKALSDIMPLLPVVQNGVRGTAREIGDLVAEAGAMAGTWGDDVGTAMSRTNTILNAARPGLLALLAITMDLIVAGGPMAQRFVEWLTRGAVALEGMVQAGRDSGGLERFFVAAGDLARDVWQVLVDLGVALFNVGRDSGALGDVMGAGIAQAVADFRAFTESVEGQTAIRDFFERAIPVVTEVGKLILDIIEGFGMLSGEESLAPVITMVRTDLLPALLALATGVTGNLGPAIVDLVTAWLEFSNVLSFDPIITLATLLGDVARAITDWIAITPGMSTAFAALLAGALGAKVALAALRFTGIGALIGMIPTLIAGTKGLTIGLRGNAASATLATGAMARMAVVGKVLRGAVVLLSGGLKMMGRAVWAALGPVGLIIAAVLAFGAGLIWLYNNNETFRKGVDAAWSAIKRFASYLGKQAVEGWRQLGAAATATGHGIMVALRWIRDTAVAVWDAVWGAAKSAWDWMIRKATEGKDWILAEWNKMVLRVAIEILKMKLRWDYFIAVLRAGIGIIKERWDTFWSGARDFAIRAVERLKGRFDWLISMLKLGVETFLSNWKTNFNNAREHAYQFVTRLREKVTGLWDSAKEKLQGFVDKLQGISLPGWVKDLADLVGSVTSNLKTGAGRIAGFFGGIGDAPGSFRGTSIGGGRQPQGYSGTALRRVQGSMIPGLRVTSTYRSQARNRAVGGSPTSLHMDRANPAVDIGGPTGLLDRMASKLRAMGGWRQLLWRVAGHYDHIHVAHEGARVDSSWGTVPGLKPDERPGILQVGERVLSRAETAMYDRIMAGVQVPDYVPPAWSESLPAPRSQALPTVGPREHDGGTTVYEYGDTLVEIKLERVESEVDVEAAVRRGIAKADRDRRERR